MMDIKQIKLADIPSEMVEEGKKMDLIFRDTDTALYFGGYVAGELVTIECLVTYKNGNAAIKSNYTVKAHRGKGYFSKLNQHVLGYAKEKGVKVINLNCLEESRDVHLKAGARVWKTTKNIFWMMYEEGKF